MEGSFVTTPSAQWDKPLQRQRWLSSPASPPKGTAVLGVVVQFSHALLKLVPHFTALQKGLCQLILSTDKSLASKRHAQVQQLTQITEIEQIVLITW